MSLQPPLPSVRLRRREFTPRQIDELYQRLDVRTGALAPTSQPQVAAKIVELSQSPKSQLKDYAQVIQTDPTITGRLLRMANSAFYAQRAPVTTLERALVVLGTDRVKAIALGFYLSRFAADSPHHALSQRIWGEGVYRAALCASLARAICPNLVGEAFIVGLLLDAAQPLMLSLLPQDYPGVLAEATSPGKLFALEYDRLEFTHVDVLASLARRWKLPRLLVRPLLWHHTLPPVGPSSDPTVLLHRLAYFAGSIQLAPGGLPRVDTPQPSVADRILQLAPSDLARACHSAADEFHAMISVFADVAALPVDVESLTERVQFQLTELLDEQFARAVRLETRGGAERLAIAGQIIEVEPGRVGEVAAYIMTESGQRLVSCTVNPSRDGPDIVARLLGLEDAPPTDLANLVRIMRSIAA